MNSVLLRKSFHNVFRCPSSATLSASTNTHARLNLDRLSGYIWNTGIDLNLYISAWFGSWCLCS